MAFEIELKAWVDDEKALKEELDKCGKYRGAYLKEDLYWKPPLELETQKGISGASLRIRRESHSLPRDAESQYQKTVNTKVCCKKKVLMDGVEVNDENEFDISNQAAFEKFLKFFGFIPDIRKVKEGWHWDCNGITVELSKVLELGWFIEMEVLSEDAGGFETTKERLFSELKTLGISTDSIEERFYTEMLRAVKAGTFKR